MSKRGLRFRICPFCGLVNINYTLTEILKGKRIYHWRDEAGEIHHCGKSQQSTDQELAHNHMKSIRNEDD